MDIVLTSQAPQEKDYPSAAIDIGMMYQRCEIVIMDYLLYRTTASLFGK